MRWGDNQTVQIDYHKNAMIFNNKDKRYSCIILNEVANRCNRESYFTTRLFENHKPV